MTNRRYLFQEEEEEDMALHPFDESEISRDRLDEDTARRVAELQANGYRVYWDEEEEVGFAVESLRDMEERLDRLEDAS